MPGVLSAKSVFEPVRLKSDGFRLVVVVCSLDVDESKAEDRADKAECKRSQTFNS